MTYLSQHFHVVLERLSMEYIVELVQVSHPLEAHKVVVRLLLAYPVRFCKLCHKGDGKSQYVQILS